MIVTTTQTVENRSIEEYLGLVAGQSIWEEKMAKDPRQFPVVDDAVNGYGIPRQVGHYGLG